ncbi:hypothetical protein [Nocardioides bruguierae]|uniref:hypothetical protein n=1 Tax=Nocardioides bruguierae TaxID=2945102 RepID=UPI002021A7FF|nr:hypothetical protein [Nocardioides bruguierae]MCL8026343.1 hypothetical protein [Nocardioides bruguierae]
MAAPKWHEGPMVALDTETTGIDPTADRIVTASMVWRVPGSRPRATTWVLNAGIPVPDEAADVHGWTTDRLNNEVAPGHATRHTQDGPPLTTSIERALDEIAGHTTLPMNQGVPLVVHNAPYDLTLLEHELARASLQTLTARPAGIAGVIDPMVIEKAYDPYRKICHRAPGCDRENNHHECGGCRGGKWKCGGCGALNKQLASLCAHYGVGHTGAHDATADALAAIRLAGRLAEAWPDIARLKLSTLHEKQAGWRVEQQTSLAQFFRKVGKTAEADSCDTGWPLQTRTAVAA